MNDSFTPVSISEKAMKEVKAIIDHKGIPNDYGLRIGVQGSGCAGISHIVGFDKKKEMDISYEVNGVTVLVDKKHVMYLIGIELDFYEGADARGFVFNSSQDKKSEPVK